MSPFSGFYPMHIVGADAFTSAREEPRIRRSVPRFGKFCRADVDIGPSILLGSAE